MRRAVFLDRDGVLDELVRDARTGTFESPLAAADVELLPGAAAAVRELAASGFAVVVVSNQPAAAKGAATPADLDAVHARVAELLEGEGASVDAWRYCRHRREDGCACRKPEPGLLLDAAAELALDLRGSWVVGDSDTDVEAGRRAGCRTVLVANPRSAHRRAGAPADAVVADVAGAVAVIVRG